MSKLVTEAKNIADRILNYMIGNNWIIKNPNTGANVARGPNAQVYAYVLDNLGDFIRNNEQLPFASILYPHTPSGSYRNFYSGSPAASAVWKALGIAGGAATPDQCGFFQTLAGTTNSVYESVQLLSTITQAAIAATQAAINLLTTAATNAANYLSGLIKNWWPAKAVDAINEAINYIFNVLATTVKRFKCDNFIINAQ